MRGLTASSGALAEAAGRFDRIAIACSFQKEASVILDLASEVGLEKFDVFTLDTGVLFEETITAWRAFEEHYGIRIEGIRGHWPEHLWETDPDACCNARKVVPLRERLIGYDAWVTGLRREQSATRADTDEISWDAKHGLFKVAPLAAWTEKDVWRRISERGLPYHELHDRGYSSIGCVPCTQPAARRIGRWPGLDKIECGIHAA